MVSRVYLSPTKVNAIVWDLSIPLVLSNSKIITASNTTSITRYDNGMPVVYRVGATDNPPNFTQLVRNIVYFVDVKTAYWLNNAIATAATEPQPLNANLSKISELSSVTAFGLGLLALEAAQQVRDKIGVVSLKEFGQAINDLALSKQPLSEQLSAIASLSSVTNFGVALLTLADAVSVRNQIGAVSSEDLQSYARLTGDGTIPTSMLPNDALVNIVSVSSEAEMLALTDVQPGDTVLRQDLPSDKLFTLLALPASDLGNWEQSGLGIQTLNGQSGPVVNLGSGDIGADSLGSAELVRSLLQLHESDNSNPHEVTVQQIGGQPYNSRLDAVAGAGPGILKVQPDQSLVQVPSSPVGELILNSAIESSQILNAASIIVPSSAVIPVVVGSNLVLQNSIATKVGDKTVVDGQQLTIVNVSNNWLFIPAARGMKAIPPGDNLTFTYSAILGGWTAPASIKTLSIRVFHSTNQDIPPGAALMTPVNFDSIRWDNSGGAMKSPDNPTRLIAPVTGYYSFNAHFQIGATGFVAAFLRINGGLVAAAHLNGNPYISFPGSYFMAGGAFADVAIRVYSAVTAANIVRIAPLSPEFEMRLYSLV